MPTYEYACRNCGHDFEARQSFSDPALTECPECGGELRKVFSPVGISFKGSGFYKTDNRSSGSDGGSSKTGEKAEKAESSDKSDSGAKKSDKSDKSSDSSSSSTKSGASGSATKSTTSSKS